MGVTQIEWCHYTFNGWFGCAKVSPGCEHCFAERYSRRWKGRRGTWGPNGTRVLAAESTWQKPLTWNRAAERAGERRRVLCGSLMDFFEEREELESCRDRVLALAMVTPHLDWLLLTKRPMEALAYFARLNQRRRGYWHEQVGYLWDVGAKWYPSAFNDAAWETFCRRHGAPEDPQALGDSSVVVWPLPNVWLGVTVEDADHLWRIDELLKIPAAVRFVSYEPALGPLGQFDLAGIDWLIAGGESGPGARPPHPDWFRSVRDLCQASGVPFCFKQWGKWAPHEVDNTGRATAGSVVQQSTGHTRRGISTRCAMVSVGKIAAGRLLDGRQWNEMPKTLDS